MTKKNPISATKNIWFDSQQVDNSDLTLEQDYNTTISSGLINNHIGDGVLLEALEQNILFDSSLENGFLDGTNVSIQNQPADANYGNQLEIELSESSVGGKKTVKLCVIGLDFESNLQYEIFIFKTNEIQISKKHFTKILTLLFNDFIGDQSLSLNLGGRLTIKESKPLSIFRDPLMVVQDQQPNLFFRDFFVDGFASLEALLQTALPTYNIESLNIATSVFEDKILTNGDVTTQIGQKFLATTNNIQKITLLMAVRNTDFGNETDLVWNGDLVISIYPLQSGVECISDIAPNLEIDFAPSNIPLAQLSFNYASLGQSGYVLDGVYQPIDFIFSNSSVAGGNVITPGAYYAFTVKRSGAANKCDIMLAAGADLIDNSRITVFSGTLWVDLTDQDLWFKVWTDAARISDGQFYESGHGAILPKTFQDPTTLVTKDYSLNQIKFTGNDVYRAVASTTTDKTVPVPDQRTGNAIFSRQQTIPDIKLLNTIDLTNLQKTSEPLVIGSISDKNRKFYDSISSTITSHLYSATVINDELIVRIVDDPTDIVRYDTAVTTLQSNLLNGDFVGAKIFPDQSNVNVFYRVASAKISSSVMGDVNGDGMIDEEDLALLNKYLNFNLNVGLPLDSTVTTDNVTTTFTNGYSAYTSAFTNAFGISFQLVDPTTNAVVASASDGIILANPTDNTLAQFTSTSISFGTIVGLSSYKLVILTPATLENYGGFDIVSYDLLTDTLTLRKIVLSGEVIMQMLRSDINGDFQITSEDGYLLQSYINKEVLTLSPSLTFPGPSTNPYTKIGKRFNVIKFKLEKFVDRQDDYSTLIIDRPTVVHASPDIFTDETNFYSHNFYTSPITISIQKQLSWDDSLIVTNSKPRSVPTVFTSSSGYNVNSCAIIGVNDSKYEDPSALDPGIIDVYAPNNIILGSGGELHRPDGNFYKVDFEVGTIVLEIPDGLFGSERTINVLDDFIADYSGDGRTRLGFPSMRFADCSFVSSDALTNDQVRFSVAVQSFSPNTNGTSSTGLTGAIVDGKIGVSIDYTTGLLTLNFTNLYQDAILKTLSTKVQINVFLKKGGFNNQTVFIDSTKMNNMLKLVSVFSGAVDGGPSALVDLSADVSGILPIIHGGTGLNDVGVAGTVLTSTGSGLSYQFISDLLPQIIAYSTGTADAGKVPKTDFYGLLDPSFLYKNPVHVYGVATVMTNNAASPVVAGALQFRFDEYILQGISSIKLEAIVETTNVANAAQIKLFDITNNSYILINGVSDTISSTSIAAILIKSDDLKSILNTGATDFIYEIHLSMLPASASEIATVKMARLTITYNNPAAAIPVTNSNNFIPNPIF